MQSLFKQLKIEKVYELLFPEKKKGLAVIWLYERMKNGEFKHGIFKEKDIHHAFEAVPECLFSAVPVQHLSAPLRFLLMLLFL